MVDLHTLSMYKIMWASNGDLTRGDLLNHTPYSPDSSYELIQ